MTTIRVGGVNEPFNLPWLLAVEDDAYSPLGIEVDFAHYLGGTGALVAAVEDGSLDLATVLTEGGVTAIARGHAIGLHSAFTTSPLQWGIHVAGNAIENEVAQLEGKRFAISRYGSGSELMAYVLGDEHGWQLNDADFIVVGGIDGAVEALPNNRADIFLWERFVTAPLVEQGVFKRIADLSTPWPAFYTAARRALLNTDRTLIDEVVRVTLNYAARLKARPGEAIDMIIARYGMERTGAATWLDAVEWPASIVVDTDVLSAVMSRMYALGRIEELVPVADLS